MPTPEYRNQLINYYLIMDFTENSTYYTYEYRNDIILEQELYNIDDLIDMFNNLNI